MPRTQDIWFDGDEPGDGGEGEFSFDIEMLCGPQEPHEELPEEVFENELEEPGLEFNMDSITHNMRLQCMECCHKFIVDTEHDETDECPSCGGSDLELD